MFFKGTGLRNTGLKINKNDIKTPKNKLALKLL
jgi:hypothetical protein